MAVMTIAGLLVFTIYFTELGVQWITFLTGILIASIISMVSRTARAEWIIARRTAQLKSIKDKLDKETQLRKMSVDEKEQSLSLLKQIEWAFRRLIPHQLLALLERSRLPQPKSGYGHSLFFLQ